MLATQGRSVVSDRDRGYGYGSNLDNRTTDGQQGEGQAVALLTVFALSHCS